MFETGGEYVRNKSDGIVLHAFSLALFEKPSKTKITITCILFHDLGVNKSGIGAAVNVGIHYKVYTMTEWG